MVGLIWLVRADAEFVQAILGEKAGRRQTLAGHGVLSVEVDRSRLVVRGCRRLPSGECCSRINGSTVSRPRRFVRCGGWPARLGLIDARSGDCASVYRSHTWAVRYLDATDDVRESWFRMRSVRERSYTCSLIVLSRVVVLVVSLPSWRGTAWRDRRGARVGGQRGRSGDDGGAQPGQART